MQRKESMEDFQPVVHDGCIDFRRKIVRSEDELLQNFRRKLE